MRNREGLSFAARVREELVRQPLGKPCCMLSEIAALTATSGHLSFRGQGKMLVSYRMEHAGGARRLLLLLKKRLNINPTLHFLQSSQLGGRRVCVLTLNMEDSTVLLTALRLLETDEEGNPHYHRAIPRHPLTRQCCRRAYFRGAFLGAGSVTNPEKGYHLEWKAEDETLPEVLERLLIKSDFPFRWYERGNHRVIYLKEAQRVADMLALMGASQNLLALENVRVHKQLRSAAVRAANCDEHNSERMLDAGARQAEALRALSIQRGLFTLPPALREMARLRIENPDMSLQELGALLDPPLGKSAVNHRLRRLMSIVEELKQ